MKNEEAVRRSAVFFAIGLAGFSVVGCAFGAGLLARRTSLVARSAANVPQGKGGEGSIFEPDKGRFRIMVNGQQVGKEEFELAANNGKWVERGVADVQGTQGSTHVTGTLELQADGAPIRYEWSTQGAKKASAVVTFAGTTATSELRMQNARPFTQQFTFTSPRVAILDNNLNYQYALLAKMYDWNKKGPQMFSVLVPQELTPGTATVESLGKQDSAGKSLEELRVKTEDNEVDLYLDGARLVRIAVPSSHAEVVRE
jgi:hypothetical protein